MKKIILATLLVSTLSGCAGVFIAGAATGGLMVYDRKHLQSSARDERIRHSIVLEIMKDPSFEHTHIGVSSFGQVVLLVGQTPKASQRAHIGRIASNMPGVVKVYNEIEVSSPSSMITRSSDTWITTKVKSRLLAAAGLDATQVKVVTENGVVYLMGSFNEDRAAVAVAVARQVSGVQKIVKIFN